MGFSRCSQSGRIGPKYADCLAWERHDHADGRAAILNATGSDYELARQFDVCRNTIRKWRKRDTAHDANHTEHRLQTTLNAAQEELVIYLRAQLLSLDGLLAVVKAFIEPAMSHSALDRLLRRRGHA